ncbi:MAG: translation initiation factor IF-2, partial [Ilumatobacteraceae bacterium]
MRVHELAKKLGMTNAEMMALCEAMGVGVKTHSSTLIEAQADRLERRAIRDGLTRDEQPEEPKPAKKAAAKKAAAAQAAAPSDTATPAAPAEAPVKKAAPKKAAAPVVEVEAKPEPKPAPVAPPVVEPIAAPVPVAASAPASTPEVSVTPAEPPPAHDDDERRRITSSRPAPGEHRPAAAAAAAPVAPVAPVAARPLPVEPRPAARPAATAASAPAASAPAAGTRPAGPPPGRPTSSSGRSIPPPPGGARPMSSSGRPIPPPPGGLRATAPSGARTSSNPTGPRPGGGFSARPGGPGGPRTGPGGPRPTGGPGGARPGGFGAQRPGGGFGGPRPGPGGPGGGPGAGPGGPRPGGGGPRPNGQRRAPRKKSRARRRRDFDDMQPSYNSNYTATNAPVPEGTIIVERGVSAQEFAPKLNRTAADVIRFLLQNGEMVTATMTLTDEQMELFALEVGAEVLLVEPGQQEELELQAMFDDSDDDDESLQSPRAPVITVMGHVDHGKTTLLDRIRHANVVAGEAGGITQHIGAYMVDRDGGKVTFIDTPGHAAFTKMRARGAQVTDIVVLVVAADDGVMPQTVEAINHAKAAEVPIVVAVNKIDKDNADPQRVLAQLAEHELVPESWGGDTIVVEMSASQNLGIDDLLEQLLAVAELEELTANPTGRAKGIVLEANLDTGRGPVATILVDKGTLKVG